MFIFFCFFLDKIVKQAWKAISRRKKMKIPGKKLNSNCFDIKFDLILYKY